MATLVKVAAYQAPLLPSGSMEAIPLIRRQIAECEAAGVAVLCCPEAILGGLADCAQDPQGIGLNVESGQLSNVLAPLASDTVTTIVGFTEASGGTLFNSAAVFHRGHVIGIYRKWHPAIRRSVYAPGDRLSVFTVDQVTFGIIICYDSCFPEPARQLAAHGARILFVASNNALPAHKADVVRDARAIDVAHATTLGVWVVRADVAGRADGLVSHGSSAIVDPCGVVRQATAPFEEQLIVAEIGRRSAPVELG